jgi:hypothetical protein
MPVGAIAGLPIDAAAEGGGQAHRRLHRFYRRAVHFVAEQAADGQRLIANHFRRQAEARAAGEEAIVGITALQFRRHPRRLPIGCRGHELFHEGFEIPLVFGEFGRQPIE